MTRKNISYLAEKNIHKKSDIFIIYVLDKTAVLSVFVHNSLPYHLPPLNHILLSPTKFKHPIVIVMLAHRVEIFH